MLNKKIYFKLPLLLLFIAFTLVIIKCGQEADDTSDDGMICEDGKVAVRFKNATTETNNIDYRLYEKEDCEGNWQWSNRWMGLNPGDTSLYACVTAKDYSIWSKSQDPDSDSYCSTGIDAYTAGYKYRGIEDDTDYTVELEGSFKSLHIRSKSRKIRVSNENSGKGTEAQETIK